MSKRLPTKPRNIQINDTTKKGELATEKILFGEFYRYAIAGVHTRFENIVWFIWDANIPDELYDYTNEEFGYVPKIIYQAETWDEAIEYIKDYCDLAWLTKMSI